MNNTFTIDQLKDKEVCKYQISPHCLQIGTKADFHGRCCRKCNAFKKRDYYEAHRDEVIQRATERQRRTYVHKRKKKTDDPLTIVTEKKN